MQYFILMSNQPMANLNLPPVMRSLILHPLALLMIFFTSITVFSATNPVNQDYNQLRSATAESENMLFISATKDSITTRTVITEYAMANNGYDGEDIPKLFTWMPEIADAYTLTEGYACAFNKFNTYPFIAPLGVRTTSLGKVRLDFIGAESFKEADVYLVNTLDGTHQNLKENTSCELNLEDTNGQCVLFVVFRKAGTTTDIQTISSNQHIQVFATDNNKIRVLSSPNDKIKEVVVFNTSGKIIQHSSAVNASNIDVPVVKNEIYLVQVFTENNTRIAKLLVK